MEIRAMSTWRKVFVFVLFCPVISLCETRADEFCGDINDKGKIIEVNGGEYRISNNVWRGPSRQCISASADSTYFSVISTTHDLNNIAAYPFIFRGRHFGDKNTKNSGMPILVSDIATAPVAWAVDINGAGGIWNSAYESWFSKAGGTVPDAAELMIWLNYKGGLKPSGDVVATVSIAGAEWDVYFQKRKAWNYIAYKKVQPGVSVTFDLKDFINDSVSRGYIETAWYLDAMEAGFEIMQDGKGLTSNSFSASVTARKGSGPINRAPAK